MLIAPINHYCYCYYYYFCYYFYFWKPPNRELSMWIQKERKRKAKRTNYVHRRGEALFFQKLEEIIKKKSGKWQVHCPKMIGIIPLAPPASGFSGLFLEYTLKIHWAMWQLPFLITPFFYCLGLPDCNVTHMFPADSLFSCPKTSMSLTILKNNERWFLK